MELGLLLYLATIAEGLKAWVNWTTLLLVLLIACTAVMCISFAAEHDSTTTSKDAAFIAQIRRKLKVAFVIICLLWMASHIATALVPTKKDVYVVVGGYVLLEAANSDVAKETVPAVYNSIEKWLDKELNTVELSNEAQKGKK